MSDARIISFEQVAAGCCQIDYMPPAQWAEKCISFAQDKSARVNGNFDLSLTPYLCDPLNAWEFKGVIKEVTVVAPEQTGKSLSWIIGLLWTMIYEPCLSITVYPSDDKCTEANEEKLKPLMYEIPRLAQELSMPRSFRKDRYNFLNLISYFQGAGSRVTSKSAKVRIADELDDWTVHEGQVSNIEDLRKRARSFDDSIFYKVCTVKGSEKGSKIWSEFMDGSQGFWHLGCLKCGKPTMRSADVHNMQWDISNDVVVEDSIRLVCPDCGREHVYSERREMNLIGEYVHRKPELVKHKPTFQWGALASQWESLSWLSIAEAQLKSGRSGYMEDQILFDNSFRGLPFKQRKVTDSAVHEIRKHAKSYEKIHGLEGVFVACDTQDDCVYYIVRAVDTKCNSYLLDYGTCDTLEELTEVWECEYHGLKPVLGIIDSGGHRTAEIENYCRDKRDFWMYKGNNAIKAGNWMRSKNVKGLLMARAKFYQDRMLYYIYNQASDVDNYNWYIPEDISEEYVAQIAAMRPDNKVKNGHAYENWTNNGNADHWFDCEKMWLVIFDYAKRSLPCRKWAIGGIEGTRKRVNSAPRRKSTGGFVSVW